MSKPTIAEFDSAAATIRAAEHLRTLGYPIFEAYTPFPIPELESILRIRKTKIPYIVFAAGATGAVVAYLILWWTNAVDYPLDVGGRPLNSVPAHVPIMFETTVLFAACASFAAALVLSGLPRLHHPVFEQEGFERTTIDRFWLTIGRRDAVAEIASPGAHAGGAEVSAPARTLREELLRLGAVAVRGAEGGAS